MKLLTRDQFRESVFARDKNKCVFCDKPAKDAHHIMERRLFPDGGYYLSNGASVCEDHHILCETTEISLDDVREAAGIKKFVIPPHLYSDQVYDKWGNSILPNGQKVRGELFNDPSVQKILGKGNVLDSFTSYVKYPRTYHLPWSQCVSDDDRVSASQEQYHGKRVIVTEKMDGENTTLYRDYMHARSVDSRNHYTRAWVKKFHASFSFDIPEDWRICGENLFAKHSLGYDSLPSYFMGFSIWNENNERLSWDETQEWFELFNIVPVPVLYDGIYDEEKIKKLWTEKDWGTSEGYVMTVADRVHYSQFREFTAKFVRKNHVMTVQHWMHGSEITENSLALKL